MTKIKTGLIILLSILIIAFISADKGEADMAHYLEGISPAHIFGYDSLGRDLFCRTMYGFLVSLSISALCTMLSLLIALLLLFLSRRGALEKAVVFSMAKAIKTLPGVVIAIFLLSFGGNGFIKLITALSLSGGGALFILLEPLVEGMEKREYITAERSLGIREGRIFFFHIVPQLWPYIRENSAGNAVIFILTEASLSFLNLGLDGSIPTLGRILYDGRSVILSHPHVMVGPVLVLFLLTFSVLLIKEGLSELDSSSY